MLAGGAARCQTTQGIITGRVFDQKTNQPVRGIRLTCRSRQTGEVTSTLSGEKGFYALLRLPPGIYNVRAEEQVSPSGGKPVYQPREVYELELFVAGRVELDVPLRELTDTYNQDAYAGGYLPSSDAIVHTYAADMTTTYTQPLSVLLGRSGSLLATLSYVVDPQEVRDLPLSGRDIYTMLVTLPGVTADNATARGLGLSVNGQRSSASNFLLDGVENNDYLLTGPLTIVAPEATEEYSVSTNNYSAEFGRTAGFVANTVTRAGTNSFHGVAYGYFNNTVLNANSFQHVAGLNTSTGIRGTSLPRQPQNDLYAGLWMGGPAIANRLFWSAAYEDFRSRGEADSAPLKIPQAAQIKECFGNTVATALLERFPIPGASGRSASSANPCAKLSETYDSRQPLQFGRGLGLGRLDQVGASGKQRFLGRIAVSRYDQPDFIYSVYPGFSSTLDVNSASVALASLWLPVPGTNNELRLAFRNESQGWDRPHSEIPELETLTEAVSLPGSPAQYAFHYGVNSGELNDTLTLLRSRHLLAFGGGVLINHSQSLLTFGRDGLYLFNSLVDFAQDHPVQLQLAVARSGPTGTPQVRETPDFNRANANNQFYGFAQDSIKVSRRWGADLGVRYESFGAPKSTGTQDGYFSLGAGSTIEARLAGATLVYDQAHQRSAYDPDRNNWAGRFGLYYDVSGSGRTVVRGAYGIFFDRPFENLTLGTHNNNLEIVSFSPVPSYPDISRNALPTTRASSLSSPTLLWLDPHLRTPYVQSWFGGIQSSLTSNLYVETTAQGALGRKLISTDLVNRCAATCNDSEERINSAIPENIFFRSNAASSSYSALTALSRYRTARFQLQVAYTWSHSIDNQSDPLQGTFEDLSASRGTNVNSGINSAAFTQQFASGADRASSDFDQRHNLVAYGIWRLGNPWRKRPAGLLLGDWQVAGIGGFRSGFPFNLVTTSELPACSADSGSGDGASLIRNRPSLLPGRSPFLAHPIPIPGGFQILDPTAFCDPPLGQLGNLGRNALTGPGFWNIDLSVSKSFRPRLLGESGALQFRADFFNAFNHPNLANPDGVATTGSLSTFGQALFGREGVKPSFPSAMPLDQLARQIQLQVKIMF